MQGKIRSVRPMAEICAQLDAAEAAAWDRVGGPTTADFRAIRALEKRIAGRRADSIESAIWRTKRLVRAALNGWCERELRPLAAAVEHDFAALKY